VEIEISFWPIIIGAAIVSVGGIVVCRPIMLYLAACMIALPSFYLASTPMFCWALLFPLCLVGSGLSLRRRRKVLAALLLIPVWTFFAWIAVLVRTQ